MKEELVQKVSHLYEALEELNDVWDRLDWSIVPVTISENYPFHQDLKRMAENAKSWLEIIKDS